MNKGAIKWGFTVLKILITKIKCFFEKLNFKSRKCCKKQKKTYIIYKKNVLTCISVRN
jgi:hypothetical protein